MTMLELTVVTLVLLSLVAILFVGARAWKKGNDEAVRRANERAAIEQRAVEQQAKEIELDLSEDDVSSMEPKR